MLRRTFVVALLGSSGVLAAAAVGACSSDEQGAAPTPDASIDVVPSDAKHDAPPQGVAKRDGGNCTAVKGPCDLVLQDCEDDATGQKQECIVVREDASLTTQCVPVQSSETLPKGRACCPGADNPCLPGLICVGEACSDGGPPTGRCSPACCEGDDQACGMSSPEGIAGSCDVIMFSNDDIEETHVCSYRERCKPFGQEPCKPGSTCLIQDKYGTAGCMTSMNKQVGEACKFGNDCADGLLCLSNADGGAGVCRMVCLTPGSIHPFDASVEDGGPKMGGCPDTEKCKIGPLEGLPGWLSLCTINGG